jgi:5'-3' exonuclease
MKREEEYYSAKSHNYKNMKISFLENESKVIESYPLRNKFPRVINISTSGWRRNYYYELFDKSACSDITTRSCKQYIQGLNWTIDYYFNKKTNSSWYYPYNYSPTILDLSNYINSISRIDNIGADNMYKPNRELCELDQLLMVLPPSSSHLIPNEQYRDCFTNIKKGYVHCFPMAFEITTFMKYQLHECGDVGLNLQEAILI